MGSFRRAVPVTAPSVTPVVCTYLLTPSSSASGFVNSSVTRRAATDCGAGTKLNVSRIAFSPDIGATSQNVATYRVTVAITAQTQTFFLNEVVAVLTEGAPVAEPIQPFRLDTTSAAQFVVALSAGSSGVARQAAA